MGLFDAYRAMLEEARQGNLAALQDLVRYLKLAAEKGTTYLDYHARDELTIAHILGGLLDDAPPGSPQEREIESLRGLRIHRLMERELSWARIIHRARSGDLKALDDLIKLAQLPEVSAERDLAHTLADIFFDKSVTTEQRQRIWALRDRVVYRRTWEEEVKYTKHIEGAYEARDVETTTLETRTQDYTFMEYLEAYRRSDVNQLGR